jgi:hypothetical protein
MKLRATLELELQDAQNVEVFPKRMVEDLAS